MELKPIEIDITTYPGELHPILSNGKFYDSSCSPEARVIFIDKDGGYFLKSAPKGKPEREATMMRYFQLLFAGLPAMTMKGLRYKSKAKLTWKASLQTLRKSTQMQKR